METIRHWINNEYTAGAPEDRDTADVTNPATGEVTGRVHMGTAATADEAVAAAKAAFPAWRDTSLTKRMQVLFRYRELLNARKEELAALITAEHGKVLDDALGEVTRSVSASASPLPLRAAAMPPSAESAPVLSRTMMTIPSNTR